MIDFLEALDKELLYRLSKTLDFYPDERNARESLDALKVELICKLVSTLSNADVNNAAEMYRFDD